METSALTPELAIAVPLGRALTLTLALTALTALALKLALLALALMTALLARTLIWIPANLALTLSLALRWPSLSVSNGGLVAIIVPRLIRVPTSVSYIAIYLSCTYSIRSCLALLISPSFSHCSLP